MVQRFCESCGNGVGPGAAFCGSCGKPLNAYRERPKSQTLPPIQSGPKEPIFDSKTIGFVVGGVCFLIFLLLLGNMEEHHGRLRMHVLGWLVYAVGGKFLLSVVLGGAAGWLAWAVASNHKKK